MKQLLQSAILLATLLFSLPVFASYCSLSNAYWVQATVLNNQLVYNVIFCDTPQINMCPVINTGWQKKSGPGLGYTCNGSKSSCEYVPAPQPTFNACGLP
ncbi:MAG: hypothetical protein A3E87_04585 [Gammaproteobacteria bacterium RIFCSPHIGHO2_12_FULL_35_23]|nr:MAG: hypothetical protein A3E87_04585 [Gammaproteobacteria bacterium RIFCSPHIGHO2_12_FULL_35_23]